MKTGNACGGALRGFEYPGPQGPVILLCSDSAKGALNAYEQVLLGRWNEGGNLMDTPVAKGPTGIDFLGRYLSYMMLHEVMHAVDSLFCMFGFSFRSLAVPSLSPERESTLTGLS